MVMVFQWFWYTNIGFENRNFWYTDGFGIPTVLLYRRFWYTNGFGIPKISVFKTDIGIPLVVVYHYGMIWFKMTNRKCHYNVCK